MYIGLAVAEHWSS